VLERFFPLIANARSLASDAALPFSEIGARLYALAREEQDLPLPALPFARAGGGKSDPGLPARPDLSRCRLAVYAWVDEILLASERPDASLWTAHSLQHAFCQTSAAGVLFFQALDELLDVLLPLTGEAEADADAALPARLDAAARLSREESFARRELDVFALCLLLGFCGRYFEMPQQREKLREAARRVLRGSDCARPPLSSKRGWRSQEFPHTLEWIFYALLPLAGTLAFGLYCADLLLGVSRIGF
jgi:type VI protein secretion system component VasF